MMVMFSLLDILLKCIQEQKKAYLTAYISKVLTSHNRKLLLHFKYTGIFVYRFFHINHPVNVFITL